MKKEVREGYKMTELGEIPEEWDIKTFKDISKVSQGLQIAIDKRYKEFKEGRLPYITIQYINNKLNPDNQYFIENFSQNVVCKEDDILMTRTGNTGIVLTNEVGVFHNNFFKVDFRRDLFNKDFLVFFLKTNFIQDLITRYAGTTTIPDLKHSDFYKLPVVIPPLEEQEKIASILSTVDEQIDNVDALIEKNKELKKSLMQTLLTKGIGHAKFKKTEIGEIPENWKYEQLNKLVDKITDGAHKTPSYTEEGIPFLRVTDIQQSNIDWENVKYISKEEHLEFKKRCNPELGDILYSKNGTIGIPKIIDWDREFSIFVSLCLIKIKKENSLIINRYLQQFLKSDSCMRQIRLRAKQGTVTNLHLEEIRELIIPIPPIEEQEKIASILSSVDNKIEGYENKKQKLEELKKGLMQQLLTGKIRVI